MTQEYKHGHVIFRAFQGVGQEKTTMEIVSFAKECGVDLEADEARKTLRHAATLGLVEEVAPDTWFFAGDQ